MVQTISLFNPKDLPFGDLSNNSLHFMEIDGKKWSTVTNYIYSNMMKDTPSYSIILQNTETKNVQKIYEELKDEKYLTTIRNALSEALESKFETSIKQYEQAVERSVEQDTYVPIKPSIADILLRTENRPIVYLSKDSFLGNGQDNKGLNLLGNQLRQLRHQIRLVNLRKMKETEEETVNKSLYLAYLTELGLNNAIRGFFVEPVNWDVESREQDYDLSRFSEYSLSEIQEELQDRGYIFNNMSLEKFVSEIVRKNRIPSTSILHIANEYPRALVNTVRKKQLRSLKFRQEKRRRDIAFDMYVNYIIGKNYENIPANKRAEAAEKEFSNLTFTEKTNMINRLWNLYQKDRLNPYLTDEINIAVSTIRIPEEAEIKEVESMDPIDGLERQQRSITESLDIKVNNDPVVINDIFVKKDVLTSEDKEQNLYSLFSPKNEEILFKVNNNMYPTIYHFILISLIKSIPDNQNAYNNIFQNFNSLPFASIETIYNRYKQLQEDYEKNFFKYYAAIGLQQKFKEETLQNLLLVTGNSRLIWTDKINSILGQGPDKKGENFVGKKLVEMRTQFASRKAQEQTIDKNNIEQISNLIVSDPFIERWMNMRIKDMCKTVNIMMSYIKNRKEEDDVNIEKDMLNQDFVRKVLDYIYNPCSSLFEKANSISNPNPPEYFKVAVRSYRNFYEVNEDVISLFWSRIVVMIQTVLQYNPGNATNVSQTIANVELFMSNQKNCKGVFKNQDNCIYSALFNVLLGISNFNRIMNLQIKGDDYEIDTAVTIILGRKETEPKNKYPKRSIPTQQDDPEYFEDFERYEQEKKEWEEMQTDKKENQPTKEQEKQQAEAKMKYLELLFDSVIKDQPDKPYTIKRPMLKYQEEETENESDYEDEQKEETESESDDSDDESFINEIEAAILEEQEKEKLLAQETEKNEEEEGAIDEIKNMLKMFNEEIDSQRFQSDIEHAVKTIKEYSLPKQIKTNRINFFATLLSK